LDSFRKSGFCDIGNTSVADRIREQMKREGFHSKDVNFDDGNSVCSSRVGSKTSSSGGRWNPSPKIDYRSREQIGQAKLEKIQVVLS
jgi:hypothetical protein